MMNSASKVLDKQGNAWEPASSANLGGVFTTTQPLDSHSGAGQIDGLTLAAQYLAGEKTPGLVDPIGWDLHSIGTGQYIDYNIDPNLIFGTSLTATLTWYRHLDVEQSAQYTLRVFGANVFGGSEQFALAWYGTAVPEPTGVLLVLLGTICLAAKRRRY
jgi:hypothetical protein